MRYKVVPENVLRLMSKEDRKPLGKAGRTADECAAVADSRHEKELQTDMVRLLDQRGLFFSRARMDKKTTTRKGLFDFTVYLPSGRYLAVEAKVEGGRLSDDQQKLIQEFWSKTGQVVHIVFSLQQFRELLDRHAG